jgi:hypothetical protein
MRRRSSMLALPRGGGHSVLLARCTLAAAMAIIMMVAVGTQADAYPARVNKACKRDYYKFCSAYSIGTPALNRCMEAKRRSLSRRCIDALRRARMIPRRYLRR